MVTDSANTYIYYIIDSVFGIKLKRYTISTGTTIDLGSNTNHRIYALAIDSSNNIYIGGAFELVGRGSLSCSGFAS